MAITSAAMLTGCGFKSDLFLPGIPGIPAGADKYEDPEELPTLDSLKSQDTEIFQTPNSDSPATGTPELGVPVLIEPLSDEEIRKNREKNKI